MTELAIPGANGTRKYRLSATFMILPTASATSNNMIFKVWVGSTGNSTETDPVLVIAEPGYNDAKPRTVGFSDWEFTPASGAKIGMSYQNDSVNGATIYGEDATAFKTSWFEAEEVLAA